MKDKNQNFMFTCKSRRDKKKEKRKECRIVGFVGLTLMLHNILQQVYQRNSRKLSYWRWLMIARVERGYPTNGTVSPSGCKAPIKPMVMPIRLGLNELSANLLTGHYF